MIHIAQFAYMASYGITLGLLWFHIAQYEFTLHPIKQHCAL